VQVEQPVDEGLQAPVGQRDCRMGAFGGLQRGTLVRAAVRSCHGIPHDVLHRHSVLCWAGFQTLHGAFLQYKQQLTLVMGQHSGDSSAAAASVPSILL
jgi:hypothetical protein